MFRTLTLMATLLAATACDAAQSASDSSPVALSWRSGPEGSKVASEGAGPNQAIRRCWPDAGGWDCLFVQSVGADFFANRYWRKSLQSEQNLEGIIGGSGYDCEFAGGAESPMLGTFRERISREGRTLSENSLDLTRAATGQPWDKSFVSNFITEKNLQKEKPFFRCADLARQLIVSGLSAVSSDAVTHSDVTP